MQISAINDTSVWHGRKIEFDVSSKSLVLSRESSGGDQNGIRVTCGFGYIAATKRRVDINLLRYGRIDRNRKLSSITPFFIRINDDIVCAGIFDNIITYTV